MELFNKLPLDLQDMVRSYSPALHDATDAQLELFGRMQPDLQACAFSGQYPKHVERDAWRHFCKVGYGGCQFMICLYGCFHDPQSLEECPHYREHVMCSRCKQEGERRAARRTECLEGCARLARALSNGDEQGAAENWQWYDIDSRYDWCDNWEEYNWRRLDNY